MVVGWTQAGALAGRSRHTDASRTCYQENMNEVKYIETRIKDSDPLDTDGKFIS